MVGRENKREEETHKKKKRECGYNTLIVSRSVGSSSCFSLVIACGQFNRLTRSYSEANKPELHV